MRSVFALSILAIGLSAQTSAQTCTGLCLQQVPPSSCPAGVSTTISGKVYAPNGIDPLPNVTVYVPNAPVDAFTSGVDPVKGCPAPGAPPSGAPLVGTLTATDGSFVINNVPVGTNIPLVIVSGKWRRQIVIPTTTACADTSITTRFPKNQSEGDIPNSPSSPATLIRLSAYFARSESTTRSSPTSAEQAASTSTPRPALRAHASMPPPPPQMAS